MNWSLLRVSLSSRERKRDFSGNKGTDGVRKQHKIEEREVKLEK